MAGRNIQHHNWKQSAADCAAVLDMSGVVAGSKVSTDQKTKDVPKGDRERGADGGSESSPVR